MSPIRLFSNQLLAYWLGTVMVIEPGISSIKSVVESQVTKFGRLIVGSTVRATAGKREITYMIVGSEEANPAAGKVSNESPLGKAFLGKKVGEHVEVKAPAGNVVYTVVEIK